MALKREQIISALIARLTTILTPAYYTDIGEHVFEYRTTILEDHELPAINVTDDTEKKSAEFVGNSPSINRDVDVTLEMLLKDGNMSIVAARRGLADMEKAIAQDITFGALAFYTEFIGSTITKEQNTLIVTGAKLIIRITYRTTKWAES
jgi:hypothetical protein